MTDKMKEIKYWCMVLGFGIFFTFCYKYDLFIIAGMAFGALMGRGLREK